MVHAKLRLGIMANFNMHLTVAAIGSGALATICLATQVVSANEVVMLTVAGTIGGLLPDIDLDHSSPTKLMFTVLALLIAFFAMFSQADNYAVIELWMLWGFCYAVVRYPLWQFFNEFTAHRGIFHSLLSALFFCFFTTIVCYQAFDFKAFLSWLVGSFVFIGFIIHLGLDEWYSVDFNNRRIKSSFGTAMKLWDYKRRNNSLMMGAAVFVLYLMTPDSSHFLSVWGDATTYQHIGERFFPSGLWFAAF